MAHELLIKLDKTFQISLNRQIYEQIRKAIVQGTLRVGDAIPPTRLLAEQLHISRSVVIQAYEQLQAEGYLVMKKGSGTFIADNAVCISKDKMIKPNEDYNVSTNAANMIPFVHSPLAANVDPAGSILYDFRHGVPAWDAFPIDRWQKVLAEACRKATPEILGYGPAEGSYALRQEVARLLRSTRSIPVVPEQIIITTGATQALDMISRLFVKSGDQVVVEDPAHTVLREIFSFSGGEVISVPVDADGLRVQEIESSRAKFSEKNGKVKLIYVTPSHQFPAGMTMSLQRRVELLYYARKQQTFIIEDDYDSEYRYVGQKVSALAGLDSGGRVIYVGSFSKTLFPALRIGYVVLPSTLIEPFLAMKWITDRMSPMLEQEALAEFIKSGQYAKHVNQMGKLYATRRNCLVQCLERHFQGRVNFFGDEAGLHLLVQIKTTASEKAIEEQAYKYGVKVYSAGEYYVTSKPDRATFLLGYANLTEHQINEGIERFADAEDICRRN